MPKIDIYPDSFCRDIVHHYEARDGETLHDWLVREEPRYLPDEPPRFSAYRNGLPMPPMHFRQVPLAGADQISLVARPGDPATLATLFTVLQVASVAYSLYAFFTYQKPKAPKSLPSPATVYDANVQGNEPRLLGIIPEHFGRHKTFPDIVSAPWREYISDNQFIYLMLCVGVGEYEIDPDDIFIGNTPVSRYGGDVDIEIFGPGENVTGHRAHLNIFTSGEVGPNEGSSGIDVRGVTVVLGGIGDNTFTGSFSGTAMGVKINSFQYQAKFTDYVKSIQGGDFIKIRTISGLNDGKFRLESRTPNTLILNLTKMLDDLSDVDPAWTVFTTISNDYLELTLLGASNSGDWVGPYLACPMNEVTERFMLDFAFPQGLTSISDEGDVEDFEVTYDIEYRDAILGGAWTTLNESVIDHTVDPIRYTTTIDLGSPMTPEVRVRRTSRESTATRYLDSLVWMALKSELASAASYPGITTVAVKVKGSNVLAAQSENKFSLIATRILPEITAAGTPVWSDPVPTRKIMAAFGYVFHDIGLEDDRLDVVEARRLDAIWNDREDYFDGIFNADDTFFEALKKLLVPGYTVPVLDIGLISFARDEPRTVHEQMFQPDNIVAGAGIEREFVLLTDDEPDGVEVNYLSEETWRPEKVLALLDDDIGADPTTVDAFGIVDRTKAWRFGMRKRREQRYRNTKHSFQTEMDAFNARFMSFCALGDDMPTYSQTGTVVAQDPDLVTLELSQPVEFTPAVTHFIALRRPDGSLAGPYEVTADPDDPAIVVLAEEPDFDLALDGTQEPTLFQFGTSARWTESVLITGLEPQGVELVNVTAMNYDERLYENDDDVAPSG